MNNKNVKSISIEEATAEVRTAITRIALMHLAYSETLIEILGEEKGKEAIIKAIFNYGEKIGKRTLKGEPDLPKIGVYTGEIVKNESGDFEVSGCQLAKIFKEYDQLELGSLYCYVDPAKSMTIDKTEKIIHKTCEACGDEKCTLAIIKTTKEDREHFFKRDYRLNTLDPYLVEKKHGK